MTGYAMNDVATTRVQWTRAMVNSRMARLEEDLSELAQIFAAMRGMMTVGFVTAMQEALLAEAVHVIEELEARC